MEKVKAVIFDLDGTLLDSVGVIIDSWHEALSCLSVSRSKRFILCLEGIPAAEKCKLLLPKKKWKERDELLAVRRCVDMRECKRIRPFPGVCRMLSAINGSGFRIAIASSASSKRVKKLIKRFGLGKHVNAVVGREDYRRGRPAPDILLAAARKLRVKPEECIAVGDTKYDVEAARRAGCVSVAILSGTHSRKTLMAKHPDFVIGKITELPRLMKNEGFD